MEKDIIKSVHEQMDERTALKLFIVGIGNAGNQLVNEASQCGFDTYAINTSKKDMTDAVLSKRIRGYIIGNDARGAGKNRSTAKALFKINGRELFEDTASFTQSCINSDIIIITGSTAGGSGSGLAPIFVKFLKSLYPKKIIIYYGILPRLTESPIAQENSSECIAEIKALSIPYLLADLQFYEGIPNDTAYSNIISHMVDSLKVINCQYINKSIFGMIDENDMRTIVCEPGYMSIYNLNKISQQDADKRSIQDMMISKIKKSPAVEIMRDGNIRHMAAILNMPETMEDPAKTGDLTELTTYTGIPYGGFENYAITSAPTGQFVIIMSGQSVPYNRVMLMDEIVEKRNQIESRIVDYDLSSMIKDRKSIGKTLTSFIDEDPTDIDTGTLDNLFDDLD